MGHGLRPRRLSDHFETEDDFLDDEVLVEVDEVEVDEEVGKKLLQFFLC